MKTLQDLILSKEFQQGAHEAVERAVAQADAAGLPKAYIDDAKPAVAPKHYSPTRQLAHAK